MKSITKTGIDNFIFSECLTQTQPAMFITHRIILDKIYQSGCELPDGFDIYDDVLSAGISNVPYPRGVAPRGLTETNVVGLFAKSVGYLLISTNTMINDEARKFRLSDAFSNLAMCSNLLENHPIFNDAGYDLIHNLMLDAMKSSNLQRRWLRHDT